MIDCGYSLESTHNLCFEKKYEKYQNFYLKSFSFLVVKFSIYLYNLCFEQKYEKCIRVFLSQNFQFLEVKFSLYLNRLVFVISLFS